LRPARWAKLAFAALFVGACRGPASIEAPRPFDLLVVAPHPDDESLMAGPLLARARARGERVAVAVVTNGDAACTTSGYVRERETLAAMEKAGLAREAVHFLGYPDGGVELLGTAPLGVRRLDAAGVCVMGDATYASEADGMRTVSMHRTSSEQRFVRAALLDDLVWLLERYRPLRVVTAHPADDHPDHAATGLALVRAIERSSAPAPKVSFSFVHLGPDYPSDDGAGGVARPQSPMRALPEEFQAIEPEERVPWGDAAGSTMGPMLASYRTQLGASPATNWLQSFDRADAPLYASPFRCEGEPRRCEDPRFAGARSAPLAAGDAPVPWPALAPLELAPGAGITVRAGAKHYRFCLRAQASQGAELLIHDLTDGEELERRFAGLRDERVHVRWVAAAPGVAELDWGDARGTFGRRLLGLRGPMTIARTATCADVP
jgi:LmbE family N-acetylglucosaminyl deacetylase